MTDVTVCFNSNSRCVHASSYEIFLISFNSILQQSNPNLQYKSTWHVLPWHENWNYKFDEGLITQLYRTNNNNE